MFGPVLYEIKISFSLFFFSEYKEAFAKFNPYRITSLQVRYDFHSIMHYGRKAFSKNGLDTIRPKDKSIFLLGNDRLSELDIKQANLLYQCDGKLSMFCLLYTSPSPRDKRQSRMPSSA